MSNILIFGASGQLGQCIKLVAESNGFRDIYFPSEDEANILDKDKLAALFNEYKPAYAVNCAAYTAVDKAEDDIDIARRVNREGAANLAHFCNEHHTTLIHISTDFVFEGNVPKLLNEDDETNPISVYGQTKLEGEQDIAAITDRYYILRTSWLYSEFGNNFVKTMRKLGSERESLNVIADQVGTPTYAIDLAFAILQIIASGKTAYGIYHYSNEGVTSWYDFAKAIFDLSGITIKLGPITTDQYPTRAIRPKFSVMNKTKIKSVFNLEVPYWRDSLLNCIKALNV